MLDGTRYCKKQVLGDKEIVDFWDLQGERGWLETSLAGFSLSKKRVKRFPNPTTGKTEGIRLSDCSSLHCKDSEMFLQDSLDDQV